MRMQRLVIDAAGDTVVLPFHHRFTVVAGIEPSVRRALTDELIGALSGSRDGLHLEFSSDDGHQFAVFRPRGARHRLIDIASAADLSSSFGGGTDRIDILAETGLDPLDARTAMCITAEHIAPTTEDAARIDWLAGLDQRELWSVADRLDHAKAEVDAEVATLGSSEEQVMMIDEIEQRHDELERRRDVWERIRAITYYSSGMAALLLVPVSVTWGTAMSIPLVVLATLSVAISIAARCRSVRSGRSEQQLLADFGVDSYLGFHIQRVNGLLASDHARRAMVDAIEESRQAQRDWTQLVGELDVGWVLERRHLIETLASDQGGVFGGRSARPLRRVQAGRVFSQSTEPGALIAERLDDLTRAGAGGETLPAIFDEPFAGLAPECCADLLSELLNRSERQQVILLTADPSIISWARCEAMADSVSIIESASPGVATNSDEAQDIQQRGNEDSGKQDSEGASSEHTADISEGANDGVGQSDDEEQLLTQT